jgi:hypothetical protein
MLEHAVFSDQESDEVGGKPKEFETAGRDALDKMRGKDNIYLSVVGLLRRFAVRIVERAKCANVVAGTRNHLNSEFAWAAASLGGPNACHAKQRPHRTAEVLPELGGRLSNVPQGRTAIP